MTYKIVSDSSSDVFSIEDIAFDYAPLVISAGDRIFVDDENLDLDEMIDFLATYKGKSHTSCPNTEDYLKAFGDADAVFCVTITRNLSGSYNAASTAAAQYMKENPGKKVHVVDSLTAGAECALIVEKLRELILEGLEFDAVKAKIDEYVKNTELIFALESLHNLAANGRVNPLVAKISGVLGIRVVGRASDDGVLEVKTKSRGMQRAVADIVTVMKETGYKGGKIRIHSCKAEEMVSLLVKKIEQTFGTSDIYIGQVRGLCAFYAERGGIMMGYET